MRKALAILLGIWVGREEEKTHIVDRVVGGGDNFPTSNCNLLANQVDFLPLPPL